MSFDIPETMTAIEITEFGGPEVLKPASRPVPQPAAGEVLVRNAAVGVNFPDTMQRQGVYPPPPGTTDIPGLELAGTVVAAGDGVSRHAPGDEVCALVSGGAYAEYTVVPEQLALPLPGGYDMIRAAAIPENFFTVWTNLFDGVQLTAGDSILIHGGSGGIGTAAIQVARAFGATVFTTARNAEKCRVCEELGATRAINYTEEDFVEVVKNATGGAGCSVVLDMVGGDYSRATSTYWRWMAAWSRSRFRKAPRSSCSSRPSCRSGFTTPDRPCVPEPRNKKRSSRKRSNGISGRCSKKAISSP